MKEQDLKTKKYLRWLEFLGKVESYFSQKGYLKALTPSLVSSPAMEACLDSYAVLSDSRFQGQNERLYLPTSPEFSLKKLWMSGEPSCKKIFEISKSFRKEDVGPWHLQEFHMLELYSNTLSREDFLEEMRGFFSLLFDEFKTREGTAKSEEPFHFKVLTLPQLFKTFLGFELKPNTSCEDLKVLGKFLGMDLDPYWSWEDLFHLLYLEHIEPALSRESFLVVMDYPPQLSALAKIGRNGFASRFEFFYRGIELGNAYDELFDVNEIRNRWEGENQKRIKERKDPHPIDLKLLEASEKSSFSQGFGVAFGLERIFATLEARGQVLSVEGGVQTWPF